MAHGAEAEDELEVLRHEEEGRELRADDEGHEHEGPTTGAVADQREGQQGDRHPALGAHEEGEQGQPDDEGAERERARSSHGRRR